MMNGDFSMKQAVIYNGQNDLIGTVLLRTRMAASSKNAAIKIRDLSVVEMKTTPCGQNQYVINLPPIAGLKPDSVTYQDPNLSVSGKFKLLTDSRGMNWLCPEQ
jgi:hypothetical protein